MKLAPSPFEMIRNGKKTIELRLYDEKRKSISNGDRITFVNTDDDNDLLRVKVENMFVFNSFEELYKKLPLLECGYTENDVGYSCAMKSHFRKFGNQMSGSGNHLCEFTRVMFYLGRIPHAWICHAQHQCL